MIRLQWPLYAFLFTTALQSSAQDFKWNKEVAGHFWPALKTNVPGYKINTVFDLVNRIPIIAHPKGYDVQEWFYISTEENSRAVHLYFNFYYYYNYQNGPTQRLDAHPPTMTISINDPKALMDDQHYLFMEETEALHLPVMFTDKDTFPVSSQTINGYQLKQGISTMFNRPIRFYAMNPEGLRFFRPITKEEYLKAFLKKLTKDFDEQSKGIVETKKTLDEFEKNEALKNSLDDLKKTHQEMIKWVAFLKSKKEYYEKKLASFTTEEKRAPAIYAMYKNPAVTHDRYGNSVEKVSGSIPYEPLESMEDTLVTAPLFTFNEKAFDPKLAKNAIQLIVISEAYQVDDDRELKRFLDKELYPFLPLKELAALMYK